MTKKEPIKRVLIQTCTVCGQKKEYYKFHQVGPKKERSTVCIECEEDQDNDRASTSDYS